MPYRIIATLIATCLWSAALVVPSVASAEGAIALGLPPDVAKGGVAIGWAVNFQTAAEAEAEALKKCRANASAPASTRELCTVVIQSFRNQCIGVALDREDGTPGFGWVLADSDKTAGERALAMCRNSSPPARRSACVLSTNPNKCDGTAK
jgi:hypothetical protein